MEEKTTKVTMEELRELIKTAPEFEPFRKKMAEMMIVVAKRRIEREKQGA